MKTKKRFRGLSGLDLKCLAMVLMVLDHLHYFFEFTGRIPLLFSQLGRLSGWLFLFCAAEGFAHTSNRKRYFLRCYGIAAAMGLIQYLIQFFGWTRADGFYPANNIFATFVLCFVLWQGLDECKKKRWLPGIGLLALPWVWYFSFARLPLSIMPYAYFLQRRRDLLSDRRLDPLRPAPSPRRSAERLRADARQLIRSDASADKSEPFYGDLYDCL